jgi:pilus assembly protein CpaE
MSSLNQISGTPNGSQTSIAVISPDKQRRTAATSALAQCKNVQTREFSDYPPRLEDLPSLLARTFDVILIDLDGDPQFALEMVETLCVDRSIVVMVFSAQADPDLMLRSMRAGAREFFTLPFAPNVIATALQWVSTRRQPAPAIEKVDGKLLVFFGSKGGVGVTTLASNFAVALAEESQQSTLLIDLNLCLGDAAINVGIDAACSIVDALQNSTRLDPTLLSTFIAHHRSGLSVLAAPAALPAMMATDVGIGSLLTVARKQFHYVVIDAGKKIDLKQMHLFEEFVTAYLVTQVGIPELRNANRLISQFSGDHAPKLEIVINRHQSRFLGLTDEHLTKALTRPIQWKIPNDYAAVRQMQSTSTPLVQHNSPIAGMIRQMAKSVCRSAESAHSATVRGLSKGGLRLPWKQASKGLNAEKSHPEPDGNHRTATNALPDPLLH